MFRAVSCVLGFIDFIGFNYGESSIASFWSSRTLDRKRRLSLRCPMVLVVCPNLAIDYTLRVDELRPGDVHRAQSFERQAGARGSMRQGLFAPSDKKR